MDCPEARRQLSAMVDERLDPERIGPLEEHLVGCPACGKAARILEETRHYLENLPRPDAPADLTARVMARIAESGARIRDLTPLLRLSTAAAAALLLVTSAGIFLFPPRPASDSTRIVKPISADGALDMILSEIAQENAPLAATEEHR